MNTVIEILEQARQAGIRLVLEGGQCQVKGPRSSIERFLPTLRKHKAELLAVLSKPRPDPAESSGHWLIVQAPQRVEMYFTPDVTRAELMERYPGALLVALPDTPAPPPAHLSLTEAKS